MIQPPFMQLPPGPSVFPDVRERRLLMKPSGLIITLLMLVPALNFSQETRDIHKIVTLREGGSVYLDTYKGSVRIKTWDKSEVEISATIEADGHGRHEEEKVRRTNVIIDESPDRVEIKSDYHDIEEHHNWLEEIFGDGWGAMPLVHYTITLPRTADLEVKDYKSDILIDGHGGELTLNTYKGDVRINNHEGGLRLETYRGDVRVALAHLTGRCRFETYKGRVEIALPSGAGFNFEGDIGRRAELSTDFDIEHRHGRDHSYYEKINGGGPLLRVETEKGNIRILQKS